jgi:hypothetical protein
MIRQVALAFGLQAFEMGSPAPFSWSRSTDPELEDTDLVGMR